MEITDYTRYPVSTVKLGRKQIGYASRLDGTLHVCFPESPRNMDIGMMMVRNKTRERECAYLDTYIHTSIHIYIYTSTSIYICIYVHVSRYGVTCRDK